jgi:hypothetical protein
MFDHSEGASTDHGDCYKGLSEEYQTLDYPNIKVEQPATKTQYMREEEINISKRVDPVYAPPISRSIIQNNACHPRTSNAPTVSPSCEYHDVSGYYPR